MFKLFSKTTKDIKIDAPTAPVINDRERLNQAYYERTEEEELRILEMCRSVAVDVQPMTAALPVPVLKAGPVDKKREFNKTCCHARNCSKLRCFRLARELAGIKSRWVRKPKTHNKVITKRRPANPLARRPPIRNHQQRPVNNKFNSNSRKNAYPNKRR